MVAIHPFRALRYHLERVGHLSRVLAPPYDVIDAAEQERLYQVSPYNVVRLILGKQFPADTETENRYTRARHDFDVWCRDGVLRQDPVLGLYLLEHTFLDAARERRARLGFIALLGLEEDSVRLVYRHEATLAAPKADRTQLLEAVPANLSPIFCIYDDPAAHVHTLLQDLTKRGAPQAQATLTPEETVRLWAITDSETLHTVTQRLASSAVLIADGHHRFEVALAHRARYGALMSYFVSLEDPALSVRPIHRVIQQEVAANPQALRLVCTLDRAKDLASVLQWLGAPEGEGHFGYYDGQTLHQAAVRPDALARWLMAPTVPFPLAALDVSILHGLILPGIGLRNGAGISYTAESTSALKAVDAGEGRAAWLLRPIPLRQVYALAAQGLTLPPKSTYFYPKVPSGLAINPLTDSPVSAG